MARVLDLTGLSGAYGARLLVEAGHDVVRVEPRDGDELRRLGPFLGGPADLERGAFHQYLNAGKRSLALDLQSEEGCVEFRRLLRWADALLAPAPLPWEADVLEAVADGLVVTEVLEDPDPELCAVARSGLLSLIGYPGCAPVLLGGHVAYALSGLYVGLATSANLLLRETTGEGRIETVSVRRCLETAVEQAMTEYSFTGKGTERRGAGGQVTATSGAFPCKDGYWIVSLGQSAGGWSRFVEWTADPVLSEDPAWSDEANRQANKDLIQERIRAWSGRFDKVELVTEAQRRHIPSSPVTTPLELVDDPQLVARGFLVETELPGLGRVRVPRGALATVFGTTPGPAPLLGQHTEEILAEVRGEADSARRPTSSGRGGGPAHGEPGRTTSGSGGMVHAPGSAVGAH